MRRSTRTSSVLTSEMSRSGGFVEEVLVVGAGAASHRRVTREVQRRGSCGTGLRDGVRQPQMPQDALNHRRVFDERNQRETPPTPGTGEHVQSEAAAHQVGQRRLPLGGRPAAPGS